MIHFTRAQKLRHVWIRSGWKHWLPIAICAIPYFGSMLWLIQRDQAWIANVMLAPVLMIGVLALLTFVLARLEFRR